MPQIPVAGPVAPGDYPSINPQAARSNWDSVARGAEAAGAVAQFGLETARRIQNAEDHTLALKAENEIQADIESVAQSFSQRNDYENFSKDATAAGEELRRKYNTQYGTNPRLWRALQPHLENQIGKATRAVERRRFDLVGDQRKADLDIKAGNLIRVLIATEDPVEKTAIKLDYRKNVEAAVIDGLLTRQQANDFNTKFELKADMAEVSAGFESNNPDVVRSMLARVEDPAEFKTLKSENPAGVNSMIGSAKKWLDAQDNLTLAVGAAEEAFKAALLDSKDLNAPMDEEAGLAVLRKNKDLVAKPVAYGHAKEELSSMISAHNRTQLEFNKAWENEVYDMANKGYRFAQIEASHAYQNLGGAWQAQFKAQLSSNAAAAESRRRATEEYELSKDARAVNAYKAKMERISLNHVEEYWYDSDPARLIKMSEQEITAKRGKYTDSQIQKLLTDRRTLLKAGPEATSLMDLGEQKKRAALSAGIISKLNPDSKTELERYYRFEREAQKQLDIFEANKYGGAGKATRDEITKVLDSVLLDQVKQSEWGKDPTKLFSEVSPEELKNSYVTVNGKDEPLSQIPPGQIASITEALFNLGKTATQQAIMEYWIKGGRKK